MDPYFLEVPSKLAESFKNDGFEPLINGDKCDVITNGQYALGDNLFFYIQTPTSLKAVTDVLIGNDPVDLTKDVMAYRVDRALKGPLPLGKKSWCGVFKTIAAPEETDEAFKMRLSLWTKKSGLLNSKQIVKLVYHCAPKKPPPPDSGERLQSGGKGESSSINKPAAIAGSTLLVLSVMGLALGLYCKKQRDKKRAEELLSQIT
jgi:hypothetical protein